MHLFHLVHHGVGKRADLACAVRVVIIVAGGVPTGVLHEACLPVGVDTAETREDAAAVVTQALGHWAGKQVVLVVIWTEHTESIQHTDAFGSKGRECELATTLELGKECDPAGRWWSVEESKHK